MKKLKPRATGTPQLLRPVQELEDEKAERLALFRAYFEAVPGAEWEIGSTDGVLVYCRWFAFPDKPEWGKVFMAYRLDQPLERLIAHVERDASGRVPPVTWDHWAHLGLKMNACKRQAVIDAFHERSLREADAREKRWIHVAYQRCLSDVWFRDNPAPAAKRR